MGKLLNVSSGLMFLLFVGFVDYACAVGKITLPFSTTFNCPEAIAGQGEFVPSCDDTFAFPYPVLPGGNSTSGALTSLTDSSKDFVKERVRPGIDQVNLGYCGVASPSDRLITSITSTKNPNDTINWTTPVHTPIKVCAYTIWDYRAVGSVIRQYTPKLVYGQITAEANYPAGGGGKGLRRWNGPGSNNSSSAFQWAFDKPKKEYYIRWYWRFQKGFRWQSITYSKIMYMPHGKVFVLYSWDSLFYPVDQPPSKCTKCGWDTMNATGDIDPTTGHRLGDGLWHWSEIHWKTNSALGVADGQFDWWIDGHLYLTNHAANVCGADANCINVGQDHAVMRTNQASPEGGFLNFQYEDWDDIVISTTGPIGPIKQGRIPSALSGSNLAR